MKFYYRNLLILMLVTILWTFLLYYQCDMDKFPDSVVPAFGKYMYIMFVIHNKMEL